MSSEFKNKLSGSWPKATWRAVDPEAIKPVRALYRQGRFLDAYELATKIAPIQTWTGGDARTFAADLAGFLAGYRLSDWLDLTAWRLDPKEESARMNYAHWVYSNHGPLGAWWFLNDHPIEEGHSTEFKFRWHSLRASIALQFRDFERARKFAAEAATFAYRPELPLIAECAQLRARDRLEPALEAARAAYAINPGHAAAQRQIVEILRARNQDDACFAFLKEALERTQDSYLLSLKVRLLFEREQFAEVLEGLDLYEKWTPLIEPDGRRWLSTRRTDACYHLGRFDEAIEYAQKTGGAYYTGFADRLKEERRRVWVRLPVGFIRQDYHTCGPATLTALGNFWQLPADHGEVAESVGFDGTYDFQERRWVQENGFFVREFKVTWDATRRLIDRGIPFALVTSWPGGSHLQAVIGYDAVWQTMLIRDPGERDLGEFDWKKTEEMYAAIGPRGMAFVPEARKEMLADLDLPEAAAYDATYEISLLLDRHRRAEALAICTDVEARQPGERMTILARRLIADYDNNVPEQLACVQKLLGLFPGDERLSLTLLSCLRDLGRREDRLELLQQLVKKENCHPLFWKELAVELSDDSREQALALKYLLRTHRRMTWQTHTVSRIADLLWNKGEILAATDLYRFVACSDHKREGPSRSYFIASRRARRTDEAIAFLQQRFQEYGARSPDPIRTLFYALEQSDRLADAFAELEKALVLRPKDGELICYAAETYRRFGKKEQARKLLADAEKESPRPRWLRTSARLAEEGGELVSALESWREVAQLQPLAEDAHREVSDLLAKTEGRLAAITYLRAVYERFPFNLAIGQLLLGWLKRESPEEAIALCRVMQTNHPSDAWTARELASRLGNTPDRLEEAWHFAQLGRDLDPSSTYAFNIMGSIRRKMGRFDEAREHLRQAIRLQVDNEFAIENLISLGATQDEKRRELLFVRDELVRQVVFGDGLHAFREQAQRALPPEEALGYLKEALAARPDLWHAWSTVTQQLVHMGRRKEALALARETAERFPLVAGSWKNLGEAYGQLDHWKNAAEALEKAVELSSDWISAIVELSEAHRRNGDWARAQTILETGLRHTPTSHVLHGSLAELLHLQSRDADALVELKQALELYPAYTWGWNKLREWGDRAECVKLCRTLTEKNPGDAEGWRRLADNLNSSENLEEMLQALDRAIALEPHDTDNYDIKAWALSDNKRFEEALATCRPAVWGDFAPLTLRGRAAWIENERGNSAIAIEMMEKVVADDSGYFWGWGRLSDWYLEDGRAPDAVRAGEQMVRLRPASAVSLGYCADARLKQGNRSGALENLRRAHVLDPDYGYATWTLFDLILDDEEYDEAGRLLEDARRYSDAAKVLAAEIRLELCRGQSGPAVNRLKEFGASTSCTVETIEHIQKEFEKESSLTSFDRALEEMVTARTATGPVLDVWVRRRAARGIWEVEDTIAHYIKSDPKAGRFAANSFLNALGDRNRFTPGAAALLKQHAAFLREKPRTWGLAGFALNSAGKFKSCADWMSDWRERSGLERWMLINLSQALRNLSREAESGDVNRRVLEIEPRNLFANLYLAFDTALAGDATAAEKFLAVIVEKDLRHDMRTYWLLTRELISSQTGTTHSLAAFRTVKARLLAHWTAFKKPDWQFVRAYNLGLARLAEENFAKSDAFFYRQRAGGIGHAWWQFRKRLGRRGAE